VDYSNGNLSQLLKFLLDLRSMQSNRMGGLPFFNPSSYFVLKGGHKQMIRRGQLIIRPCGIGFPKGRGIIGNPEIGKSACALGMCAIVFPEDFKLLYEGDITPTLFIRVEGDWEIATWHQTAVCHFFNISRDESRLLFDPCNRTLTSQISNIHGVMANRC
jgi:hypothetical protein